MNEEIIIEHAGESKSLSKMLLDAANGYYSFHHWRKVAELAEEFIYIN